MNFLLDNKNIWAIGNRPQYMNRLTRNQTSIIFKARTRMLNVKSNYKNGNDSLNCRLCGKSEETQNHILEECNMIDMEEKITKEMIFSEETEILKKAAQCIQRRMDKLTN